MSFKHDEEGGFRQRHTSVTNYVSNVGAGYDGARCHSTVAPAGSVSRLANNENKLNQADDSFRKMSVAVSNLAELTADAKAGAEAEKNMGFREAARLYPMGVFFSFGLSLAVVMEGYDTWLLGSFWGIPAFAKKYGEPSTVKDGVQQYEVSASWQNAFVASGVSSMIGLMANGIVSERLGYRKTMMISLVLISCFLFVTFFAVNIEMLLGGYVLSGLPWGVFQTITTTYAAEVTPVALRPYLTTYVNLCWVIGQLIASGILKGMLTITTQWAYRIPFAIQWIWPVPIFIICFMAPDKIEEARTALLRLTSKKNVNFNVEDSLAMMIHTNELEIQQTAGTSYSDCFKGVDLRRTEVTVMTWVIQNSSGSPMIGWGTYFMLQVGLTPANAYSLGIAQSAMGFIGTVGSWFLMPHFGRRTLYLWGQIVMFIGLIIIGGLGITRLSTSTGWAIGALMLMLTFVYDFTIGPVCYSLVAELPSTRLRIKTVVLARTMYNFTGIIIGILQPRFVNPTAWNWGPKGLTYAELDVLFENKVSARKFRIVEVDPYRSDNLVVSAENDDSDQDFTAMEKH